MAMRVDARKLVSVGKSGEALTVRRKTVRRMARKLLIPRCQEKPLRRMNGNRTSNRHR